MEAWRWQHAVGVLERTGLWLRTLNQEPEPRSAIIEAFQENLRRLQARPPDEHVQFLWDPCMKEVGKEKCLPPGRAREMRGLYREGFAATPCFAHIQASGKMRRIGNGKAAWTNKAT